MKINFTLQLLLLFFFALSVKFSKSQVCATSERLVNPNLVSATSSYTANSFSYLGWSGRANNPSNPSSVTTGSVSFNSNGLQFSQDGVSQTIGQSITNANLKGNGATITLDIAINYAHPQNTSGSSLSIQYNNTTYASISMSTGTPSTASVSGVNGASVSSTTLPVTVYTNLEFATLTIQLPNSIPNTADLLFWFTAGASSGDFHIKSASFKACPTTFSGSILDDKNGLTDNLVNSTGTVTIPSNLFVNLVNNNTGTVASSTAVSGGTYSLPTTGIPGTQPSSGYSLILTTSASSTTASAPSGWVLTGQSTSNGGANVGTGATGRMNIGSITATDATYYYGINSIPVAIPVNKGPYNGNQFPLTDVSGYKGILSSDGNAAGLAGTDAEDGSLGTGSSFKIVGLTTGTQLYYGTSSTTTTQLTVGSTITNYNPALLRMYGPLSSTGVYFSYQAIDQALTTSATQTYSLYTSFPLPVTLADFTVNSNNGIADLSWKGTTEINFASYIIEASADDTSFTPIGQLSGQGSGTIYQFEYKLIYPTTYFRLKMVDLDGSIKYSNILSSTGNNTISTLKLFPNPVESKFTLSGLPNGNKNIEILDISGRVLHSYQTSNIVFDINIPDILTGVYLVKIKGKNGKITTLKFIKK